jgi:hypothetical protein
MLGTANPDACSIARDIRAPSRTVAEEPAGEPPVPEPDDLGGGVRKEPVEPPLRREDGDVPAGEARKEPG